MITDYPHMQKTLDSITRISADDQRLDRRCCDDSLPHAIFESARFPQAAMLAWDDRPMIFGEAAFEAGQIVGLLILVAIGIGLVRTGTRSDLTLREKILGTKKTSNDE